jgi:DNA invertase Pin-like site-specific DNA recombinase
MVLTVLGMVAEMEVVFIRDRQRAGIDAAKASGVQDRPATFERGRIVALRKEGMAPRESLALSGASGATSKGAQSRTA